MVNVDDERRGDGHRDCRQSEARGRVVRFALAVLLGVGGIVAGGCSDTSQRMSEFDALQYKKALIEEYKAEISPAQAAELMYHPSRSQDDIDAAMDSLREDFAAQQEAERARLQAGKDNGSS